MKKLLCGVVRSRLGKTPFFVFKCICSSLCFALNVENLFKDSEEYLAGCWLERGNPQIKSGLTPLSPAYLPEVLSTRVAILRRRVWVFVTQPSDTLD